MPLASSYPIASPASGDHVLAVNLAGQVKRLTSGGREKLFATRTYFVATTGSDTLNDGLTGGAPFLTPQKAINVIWDRLDLGSNTVTISLGAGTFTGDVTISGPLLRTTGGVVLDGAGMASTTIAGGITLNNRAAILVSDLKIDPAAGHCIGMDDATCFFENINFAATTGDHIHASQHSKVYCTTSYTISGGAENHIEATYGSIIVTAGGTVTVSGTPAFSSSFAACDYGSTIVAGQTYSGSATGKRFAVSKNGVIDTFGAGINYFPGNVAGTGTHSGVSPWGLYV